MQILALMAESDVSCKVYIICPVPPPYEVGQHYTSQSSLLSQSLCPKNAQAFISICQSETMVFYLIWSLKSLVSHKVSKE